ncbi:MAG: FAD-dependent oxidoreductase, partial [Oscillospiraceae bacterium]|nr:FAD-dependent oxidoreductase [Oscillospiraceae bacterium]
DRDCSLVKDCTETEINTRATMLKALDYLKEACPIAFRDAYLYDIAPQLGTRGSCRIGGEYQMTTNDFAFAYKHDDVIAWHSTICLINDCAPIEIPYRAILPQKVENILAPGRHISADNVAIDWCNLIPQCVGTGQAAGVAAAVAVATGTNVRNVDIRRVQDILAGEQDVPLPRNEHTDRSYTELCEEHQYGLYTELAAKAREAANALKDYRQW